MTKSNVVDKSLNDFYKTNGGEYVVYNDGPSLCRQEFADECDINTLMARYERTGVMPQPGGQQFYADFTEIPGDLMSTLAAFDEAEKAFMQLPAGIRKEFENNPHYFVEYAQDPENLEQMRAWGLAKPAPVEPQLQVEPKAQPGALPPGDPAKAS